MDEKLPRRWQDKHRICRPRLKQSMSPPLCCGGVVGYLRHQARSAARQHHRPFDPQGEYKA